MRSSLVIAVSPTRMQASAPALEEENESRVDLRFRADTRSVYILVLGLISPTSKDLLASELSDLRSFLFLSSVCKALKVVESCPWATGLAAPSPDPIRCHAS